MMTLSIQANQTFQQTQGNLVSDMNGEKVLMSIAHGKYYNLGAVGGRIWDIMENPVTFDQIVALLLEEFDVDQASCEQQVQAFLESLLAEGLVQTNA